MSNKGLAVLFPVGLILSPSFLCWPVDIAIGVVIPYHMHAGVTGVIEDYVPRNQQPLAKGGLLVISLITALGLLKINLCGQGITESIKALWREPKTKPATA